MEQWQGHIWSEIFQPTYEKKVLIYLYVESQNTGFRRLLINNRREIILDVELIRNK